MCKQIALIIGFTLTTLALVAADTENPIIPGVMGIVGLVLMLFGGIFHGLDEEVDVEEIIDRDADHINRVVEFEKRERKRKR